MVVLMDEGESARLRLGEDDRSVVLEKLSIHGEPRGTSSHTPSINFVELHTTDVVKNYCIKNYGAVYFCLFK